MQVQPVYGKAQKCEEKRQENFQEDDQHLAKKSERREN